MPQDGNGHGTHVAGTIAAVGDNGSGLIGVAPSAKVLPLRALDNNGSGFMSDIAAAFDYAGDLGVRIVNASLGGGYASILGSVVASHPDTLYVVAAGNDNADNDNAATASFPCALPEPNVLCVGATDADRLPRVRSRTSAARPSISPLRASASSPPGTRRRTPTGCSAAPRWRRRTSPAPPRSRSPPTPTATTSQLKWALTSSVDVKTALATASVDQGPPERRRRRRRALRRGPAGGPDARADRHAGADRDRHGHAGRPRGHRRRRRRPRTPRRSIVTPPPGRRPGRRHARRRRRRRRCST